MVKVIINEPAKTEVRILSATVKEIEGEPYTGDYIVTPLTDSDRILATKLKTMTDNVTVKKIPYQEVSNVYGVTATIG